ncbi:hypothetical protein M404DRAFT_999521, partial [Pisolithus tinctorius Marx 270]
IAASTLKHSHISTFCVGGELVENQKSLLKCPVVESGDSKSEEIKTLAALVPEIFRF